VAVASGLEADMNLDGKAALFLLRADPAQKLKQAIKVAAFHLMPANRPLPRRADPDEPLRSAQFQCDENWGKLRLGDGRYLLNKHDRSYCSGLDASTIGLEAPAAS
jgi:hypothetical protein